jgi:hypothetical protein
MFLADILHLCLSTLCEVLGIDCLEFVVTPPPLFFFSGEDARIMLFTAAAFLTGSFENTDCDP